MRWVDLRVRFGCGRATDSFDADKAWRITHGGDGTADGEVVKLWFVNGEAVRVDMTVDELKAALTQPEPNPSAPQPPASSLERLEP